MRLNVPPDDFIVGLPKAELHVHIEGTLEPELAFALAARNNVALRHASVDALRAAYQFEDLQSFLDLYYEGAAVLLCARDFYDLTMAYLERAHRDGVVHAEIFFDPQTHTERGVEFGEVVDGIRLALADAHEQFGLTSRLIMCFLRHLSEASAFVALESALSYREHIDAVGLDSSELGHPPSKFTHVFARARELGFRAVAHAGEEGPPEYIWQALDLLQVTRIDHGVAAEADRDLLEVLRTRQIPLTVCPLSNLRLAVVSDLTQHNLRRLLEFGLCVTINSDDPAYFGGYVAENYRAIAKALTLNADQLVCLAENSIRASFLDGPAKSAWMARIREFVQGYAGDEDD